MRIERRPLELLFLLAERDGHLVTRDDIAGRLWGPGYHVEIDMGINTAIGKIRKVLDTQAAIETVPGKGYRLAGAVAMTTPDSNVPEAACMIAVLPFENFGALAEHDYLADGFTEETIALLGQIEPERLRVIGRTSVMAYRGTTQSLSEIALALAVDYLVESSLRVQGERLRINSRLIRAADQSQMWSAGYDGDLGSVLDLQQALAATIAEQVRFRLVAGPPLPAPPRQTGNVEAYDLYLRGRAFWNRGTGPASQKAIDCFQRAAAMDPDYTLAWSGLADAYAGGPIMNDLPPRAVWARAREAADRAIASGPDLAEAQAARGFVAFWLDWDWVLAGSAFARAVAANPSFAFGHRMVGICASHLGRHEEATRAIAQARALDPLYAMHHALSSQIASNARDDEAAVRFGRHATIIDPEFWIGHFQLGQAYVHAGKTDLAFDALTRAGALAGGNSKTISLQGYLLGRIGRAAEARERIETLMAIARARYVPPYGMALVHAGLGDEEAALDWLDRAHDAHDVHLVFLPIDRKWDFLRGDTRFAALLGRCGLSQPAFAD